MITEAIWPCIERSVDYLVGIRNEKLSPHVRSGINFSIVLGSACYLEGVIETLLRALLAHRRSVFNAVDISDFETRRSMNVFYNRLEEDLSTRIARSLGAEGYNEIFELFAGIRLSNLDAMKPLWEAVTVLFNFRNVLGHGRQVTARQFDGTLVEGGLKEDFSGSYRRVEDYLRKNGLLNRRFIDASSEYIFLSDNIANHFWAIAKDVPGAVIRSLPSEESEMCASILKDVRTRPLDA
jgi:hypothetical protein